MAVLELEGIAKIFPSGAVGVRDLTLTVRDGELLVLVGPSGCGKTTTLRLVAGLEEPTAGTIRLGSRVVTGDPPRRRDVARRARIPPGTACARRRRRAGSRTTARGGGAGFPG